MSGLIHRDDTMTRCQVQARGRRASLWVKTVTNSVSSNTPSLEASNAAIVSSTSLWTAFAGRRRPSTYRGATGTHGGELKRVFAPVRAFGTDCGLGWGEPRRLVAYLVACLDQRGELGMR